MTDPRRFLVALAVAGVLATAPLLVPHAAAARVDHVSAAAAAFPAHSAFIPHERRFARP